MVLAGCTRRVRRSVASGGVALCAVSSLALACGEPLISTARVERLHWTIDAATRAGAYACAPRELALARAHYDFVQVELAHGNPRRALQHLEVAEENAGAAQVLTPEQGCESSAVSAPSAWSPSSVPVPVIEELTNGPADGQNTAAGEACTADHSMEADGCGTLAPAHSATEANARLLEHTQSASPIVPTHVGSETSDKQASCSDVLGDANCPIHPDSLVSIAARELLLSAPIAFDGESAVLLAPSQRVLDAIVQVLTEHPSMTLEIAAYSDSRDDAARNRTLSQAQADSVRAYLIERGVAASRLTAQGYGETRPIESNSTSRGRATNRRIELIRTERAP
jgi:outer membrane protein OmpA-like peptidoglycan-associated protein